MPTYDVMVDGERAARVKSEDDVRAWIDGLLADL